MKSLTIKNNLRSNSVVRKLLICIKALKWLGYFLANSGVFAPIKDVDTASAKLRKGAHGIEKGLSLPEVRPLFGREKILRLLDDIERYKSVGRLKADVAMADAVLASYLAWHVKRGHVDTFLGVVRERLEVESTDPTLGGVVEYDAQISTEATRNYDSVVLSRRSVRNFDARRVAMTDLEDAIRVAWSSPSVCNRQPWAVAIAQGKDEVASLLCWQSGNRGFDQSIGTLLVVFSDTRAFVEDYEIFEPFVDAGIFSGALVNALHARGIGSCCLNLCVSHHVARRITAEIGAPQHMFPVMMLACGYPAEPCEVAISTRGPAVIFRR